MYLQRFSAFFAGLVFGVGLILSGMSNPEKVLGFLDLRGLWDPSLAFVMSGAIVVGFVAFQYARKRKRTFLGETLLLPASTKIDKRLALGSVMFGAGWGVAGFCPGPAIVSLASGQAKSLLFVVAMVVGMLLYELVSRKGSPAVHSVKGSG